MAELLLLAVASPNLFRGLHNIADCVVSLNPGAKQSGTLSEAAGGSPRRQGARKRFSLCWSKGSIFLSLSDSKVGAEETFP